MDVTTVKSSAAEFVDEGAFLAKFQTVPDVVADWIGEHLDISQATMMDFGCGAGVMSLGMAVNHQPRRIVGVDLGDAHRHCLSIAQPVLGLEDLPPNLEFKCVDIHDTCLDDERFDCIYSWSVFEHVDQAYLDVTIERIYELLKPGGLKFLQIGALFHSAYGSHLWGYVEPWAHLRVQHNLLRQLVLEAPLSVAPDSDPSLELRRREVTWDCYETLNRVTADGLTALLVDHGFTVLRDYLTECSEPLPPGLDEIYDRDVLTTEQIVLLLQKPMSTD